MSSLPTAPITTEVSLSLDENLLGKRQERSSEETIVEGSAENESQNKKVKRGYEDIIPENALFYNYYFNIQQIVKSKEEMDEMMKSFQEPLPTTFRINKSLPLDLIEKIQNKLNEFKLKVNNYIYLDGKIFPKEKENDVNTIDIIHLRHINELFYQIHPNISKTKLRKSSENDDDDDIQQFDTTTENTVGSVDGRVAEGQGVLKEFREYLVKLTDIGYISRQELVSMIPPLCFTPQDENLLKVDESNSSSSSTNEIVNGKIIDGYLDMCSAPGSKSAQMVEYYLNEGDYSKYLICNDIDRKRLGTLFSNLNREPNQLTNNVVISHHNAVTLHQQLSSSTFNGQVLSHIHHILCDAVCSGDGTLRKSRDLWDRWNYEHGHHNHATQVSILVSAMQIMLTSFNLENTTPLDNTETTETTETINNENSNVKLVKYNGEYEIVYSTCSLNPIEDEAVVAEAIRKTNYRFELVDLETSLQKINNNIKYLKGIDDWKVVDSFGNVVNNYEDVQDTSIEFTVKSGDKSENMPKKDGCKKIQSSMFVRDDIKDMNLQYTMRILPHMNNSGGFYVAKLRLKKMNTLEENTKRQRKLQQKLNKKKFNQEKNQSNQKQNLKHNIYVRVLPELLNHVFSFYQFKPSIDIDINNFLIQTTGESKYVKYLQQLDKNSSTTTTTTTSTGIENIPTPKKINFVPNKYLSNYLRTNYSYNESLMIKLFNAGNIAFDIDSGKFQISLAGAISLIDYIEPESKQLIEISKPQLKQFLTEGKLVFENDFIKETKIGGVILYTKLEEGTTTKRILAVGYKHSFNTIFNRLTKDETKNTLVKLDYDFYY